MVLKKLHKQFFDARGDISDYIQHVMNISIIFVHFFLVSIIYVGCGRCNEILLSAIAASEIKTYLHDYIYVCSHLTKCVTEQTDD